MTGRPTDLLAWPLLAWTFLSFMPVSLSGCGSNFWNEDGTYAPTSDEVLRTGNTNAAPAFGARIKDGGAPRDARTE